MTELELVVAKIEADIMTRERGNLSMQKLCLNILKQLKSSPLKQTTSGRQYLGNPDREEQIRIEFIQDAQKIGDTLAMQNFDVETEYPGNQFFQNLIRCGLAAIGREFAADYAQKLYPELRHLRDNGEKPPHDNTSSLTQKRFYGFTLKNYRDHFELDPVMEMEPCTPASIYYDEEKKRYIEEFIYDSPERADAMHGAWERFITKKTIRAPVVYRFSINYDTTDQCSISPVSHALFSVKENKIVNPDGSYSETRIFQSLFEATRVRSIMQREWLRQKEEKEEMSTEPIRNIPPEKTETRGLKLLKSPIHQKPKRELPENSPLQQNNKGRAV